MKFKRLVVLLPCHSLEDLSLRREAAEADQLLAAWSALWHPALVAAAESIPAWNPAETPPANPAEHLVVIPPCSEALLASDWPAQAQAAGAVVLRQLDRREAILAQALEQLDPAFRVADADLVADFMALGLGQFLIEVLTRQLRYMSNLDETTLQSRTLQAASVAVSGDIERARSDLQSAFDVLHEAREYFYPVEAHLLDLTLVTPATTGAALRAELAGKWPKNLLLTGEALDAMAAREPDTLRALAEALEKKTVALVGGEYVESCLPLLPPEAIAYRLQRGLAAYERHLHTRPAVFGRRRFGLTPALPQILRKYGFTGGLHFTLDDGRFPTGNQSRTRWEGFGGTTLEMLARVPLDAGRSDTFLRLPERLGDVLDLDHVATLVLAHWPGYASPWYADLQRIAWYTSALGKFQTLSDYLGESEFSGHATKYTADEYRAPYLRQATDQSEPDPISRWVRYYRRRTAAEVQQTLATMNASLDRQAPEPVAGATLLDDVERSLDAPSPADETLDQRLPAAIAAELRRLHRLLGAAAGPGEGHLVVNPWTFSQRLRAESLERCTLGAPPSGSESDPAGGAWPSGAIEIPGLGFTWIGPEAPAAEPAQRQRRSWWPAAKAKKEPPPLAEEHVLRNEFFEVVFSPTSGGIQTVSDYERRESRLGQQIAMRLPRGRKLYRDEWGDETEDPNYAYSLMAADEIALSAVTPALGEMRSRGRLVAREGDVLAHFVQTTRVRRGSRVLELEIELDIDRLPDADPWRSYYAARFAWSDEAGSLYRSVNMASRPTDVVPLEAPHFVELRHGELRTTILSGGLPYHRRNGLRMLDTLLVVRGETARRFRLGVGIDLAQPMPAALEWLAPRQVLSGVSMPAARTGWLFHLDVKNVVATHWEPLLSEGRVDGFRVRLLETEGRSVAPRLRCFRALRSARKIRPGAEPTADLPVESDRLTVEMGPHEWADVECLWN